MIRPTPPPTAIPMMAPLESLLVEAEGGAEADGVEVTVGIALVGVRDATDACCVK